MTGDLQAELDFAVRVAQQAGEIVRAHFGAPLAVDMKGWADPVTVADREAEALIRQEIVSSYPADGIHGEELEDRHSSSGRVWLVDPLDGTANYAGGMPTIAVCLALLDADGQPQLNVTHDPLRCETFHAVRGGGAFLGGEPIRPREAQELSSALVHLSFPRDRAGWLCSLELVRRVTAVAPHARNVGSSALAQAYVACGRLHAHARVSVGEYDIVGGNLMIAEAGGVVTDLGGGPFADGGRGLLAASATVHSKLLTLDLGASLEAADCDEED